MYMETSWYVYVFLSESGRNAYMYIFFLSDCGRKPAAYEYNYWSTVTSKSLEDNSKNMGTVSSSIVDQ